MVRIAVTTIMKDESAHVARWAKSAQDADLLLLGDTGSTDGSVDLARSCGVSVVEMVVTPWRFDTARNTLLSMTPPSIDVVVTLDVDEVLTPGWRELLEAAIAKDPWPKRWSYEYVWNWVPGQEGTVPDVMFRADRCHSREGWRWHGVVHEVLVPAESRGDLDAPAAWAGFRIEHYADADKSRSSYLELLRQAVREEPHNPRQRFYLGREYFFVGRWETARQTLVDFLAMPEATWTAERAEAYRYLAKMDDDPERWFLKALAEAPERRDAVVDLVDLYQKQGRWTEAAGMAARALAVRQRPGDYMSTARVWDDERLERIVDGIDRG
jgi:hypothetical protein